MTSSLQIQVSSFLSTPAHISNPNSSRARTSSSSSSSTRPLKMLSAVRALSSGSSNGRKNTRHRNASEEAISQLESMLREPGEVLDSMREQLSSHDLQMVLSHFAEEGRDSWFALEVFEWMQKVNRVEDDTQELMMSIMVNWVTRLVDQGEPVEQVRALLEDVHYVGLKPVSRILHSIVSAYWTKERKAEALKFVKEVMTSDLYKEKEYDPLRYLIANMVSSRESPQALKLVAELRNSGLQLKGGSYGAAMLAAVDEQEQLSLSVHKLKKCQKKGLIAENEENDGLISAYERSLHQQAEEIAQWAAEDEELQATMPAIYERLLAMYCLAGKALDAERNLWHLKLSGKSPVPAMFNAILGICAYNNRPVDAYRILGKMESSGRDASKLTFSVLIGGFIKGGNPAEAASATHKMLERGFRPEVPEMLVVLTSLQKAGLVPAYLKLFKALAERGLMESPTLYFYLDSIKLWIIRML